MLQTYLKLAVRNLAKNKLQNGINILGLSIGITGALLTFLVVRHQLNFDSQHSNADQIYKVVQETIWDGDVEHWSTTCYPLAAALRSDFPGVRTTQTAGPFDRIISYENKLGEVVRFEESHILFVDANFLDFFDFQHHFEDGIWLAGNPEKAFDNPSSIVLTEKRAKRYFGKIDDNILGKTMLLNNKDELIVTGIIKNPPENTSLLFDLLVPYEFFRINNPYPSGNWSGNYMGSAFALLPADKSPDIFTNEINDWKKKYLTPEDQKRIKYQLQPLADVHLNPIYDATPKSYTMSKTTLGGLAIMAAFLLLIGCINFINLATARVSSRAKEVGVSKVLGGSRRQLQVQYLSETGLLTLLALFFSFLMVELIIKQLNGSLSLVDINLKMTSSAWLFGFLITGIVILLAGWYPAFILSNLAPIQSLKEKFNSSAFSGLRLRKGLIVLQFGIVYLLIVGTVAVSKQMHLFMQKDMGFDKEAVVTINIPKRDSSTIETFRNRLLQHPGIEKMSYATGIPMTSDYFSYGTDFRFPHEPAEAIRFAEMKVVDLEYMDMYDLKLIAGTWLTEANKQNRFNEFIANETFIKTLGLTPEEAIGQEIVINEGMAPIKGVIEDFHNNPFQQEVSPCLLFYYGTGFFGEAGIKLNTADHANLAGTLAFIEKTWQSTFPKAIFKYQFIDESIGNYYLIESFIYSTFKVFSFLSVLIGCIGLFGLMAFITETRTKEIGVRKVLGASVANIIGLLTKDFVVLVFMAILFSAPIAFYFLRGWLNEFSYRIDLSVGLFLMAGFLAILIPAITVGFQSLKAALANPVDSLRNE
ncbi:MAG: FtsX-like permease family protein [Bacteroidota bacterium]